MRFESSPRFLIIPFNLHFELSANIGEMWPAGNLVFYIGREGILRKNVYDTTSREVEVLCVLGILVKVIYARFIRIFFLAENIFGVILCPPCFIHVE